MEKKSGDSNCAKISKTCYFCMFFFLLAYCFNYIHTIFTIYQKIKINKALAINSWIKNDWQNCFKTLARKYISRYISYKNHLIKLDNLLLQNQLNFNSSYFFSCLKDMDKRIVQCRILIKQNHTQSTNMYHNIIISINIIKD